LRGPGQRAQLGQKHLGAGLAGIKQEQDVARQRIGVGCLHAGKQAKLGFQLPFAFS
jgi:hypothetical protein